MFVQIPLFSLHLQIEGYSFSPSIGNFSHEGLLTCFRREEKRSKSLSCICYLANFFSLKYSVWPGIIYWASLAWTPSVTTYEIPAPFGPPGTLHLGHSFLRLKVHGHTSHFFMTSSQNSMIYYISLLPNKGNSLPFAEKHNFTLT